MSILLVLVIGLVAGAIARSLMVVDAPGAWTACMCLGLVGAITGYALARWGAPGDHIAMHSAAIGGLGLLAMYRMARREP